MKKLYNYISYCVYSLVPLYIIVLPLMLVKFSAHVLITLFFLIAISVIILIVIKFTKPTNLLFALPKEVGEESYFNYNYFILSFFVLIIILWKRVNYQYKLLLLIILFLICYLIAYKFKSLMFYFLGYKVYNIRGKIVYSKKDKNKLILMLKNKKSLQVIELSSNIYIEKESYNLTKFYCEDF